MLLSHDPEDVRAAEEPLLAAGVPLMDRAAFALAVRTAEVLRAVRGRVGGARVALLVGAGNNGGDALHAGARLARRGAHVTALLAASEVHPGGLAALVGAHGRVVRADGLTADGPGRQRDAVDALLTSADVVLDGLLGIGARGGGVRGAGGALVDALARARTAGAGPVVVAVDVPSGIGVADGTAAGAVVRADLTVTFGTAKPGLLLPPAAAAAGAVETVDIGLALPPRPAVARLEAADAAHLWPVPGGTAQKYSRGVLGVVAGSAAYPGAAVLSVSGALAAGVGMVRYQGDAAAQVLAAHPEVVVGTGRVQAWVLGSGVAPDDEAQRDRVRDALAHAVEHGEPAVVDAGALDLLPDRVPAHVVLTPHAGELATLLRALGDDVSRTDVEAAPLTHARRAHELTGATVLLKGGVTVVVGPYGTVYAQADAPAWLATAGAGDVLGGVLGAVLAGRSADALEDPTLPAALAALAALVHGRAAHEANPGGPVAASDVAAAVPAVVRALVEA
ncbi:bifunctional ADP-dependent NAD(P)H-hydrate dehydratase/NAD(P)H-hydrate epimerase [Cellulomonas telluris]|uniref:bifunctional ADP-dependent NAD(P)H-hydrate dehydratase/NAD(P)H-hydrate epimerase n=1 Tax=Cellulomonas telluris TaxID=2306636 RepID=UPI001FE78D96|nr:bifunctional ADP-dependent NAD(P)H-hydrate dehydratase/NAD(P)H-hydrate epimerase [Cellulomonas telluris]